MGRTSTKALAVAALAAGLTAATPMPGTPATATVPATPTPSGGTSGSASPQPTTTPGSTPAPAVSPAPSATPSPTSTSTPGPTAGPSPTEPRPKLVLDRLPATASALRTLIATGRVTPAVRGRTVTLQRRVGTRWRAVAAARTTTTGTYRIATTYDRTGSWTLRTVTTTADRRTLASATARVAWQARLDPRVSSVTARDLRYSYRSGCPVGPSSLRRLQLTHWLLDGKLHRGELILHRSVTDDMSRVFAAALAKRFPIQKMVRVDAYRGNDPRSMRAGNTSAFNCRKVVGNPYRLSRHSWGDAIDINPAQNPYQDTTGRWWPEGSASYRNRSPLRDGMHGRSTAVPAAMRREGWPWGARWSHPDYHHFSRTGQ